MKNNTIHTYTDETPQMYEEAACQCTLQNDRGHWWLVWIRK